MPYTDLREKLHASSRQLVIAFAIGRRCACGSEIRIHSSGWFLYAATRGHDSIAAFKIHPESGRLTFIEREAVHGSAGPRHPA